MEIAIYDFDPFYSTPTHIMSVKILAGERKWQTSGAECEVSVLKTSIQDFA